MVSGNEFHPRDCWCEPCGGEPVVTEEEKQDRLYCAIHGLDYDYQVQSWSFYNWREQFAKTGDPYAKERMEVKWHEGVQTFEENDKEIAERKAEQEERDLARTAGKKSQARWTGAAIGFYALGAVAMVLFPAPLAAGLFFLGVACAVACIVRNTCSRRPS
jgi:hypothetical protein